MRCHVGQILDFHAPSISARYGRITILSNIATIFSIQCKKIKKINYQDFTLKIVEKHQKVLDHMITLYAIHFGVCLVYNYELPKLTWFLYNAAFIVVSTLVGEFVCMSFEKHVVITLGG